MGVDEVRRRDVKRRRRSSQAATVQTRPTEVLAASSSNTSLMMFVINMRLSTSASEMMEKVATKRSAPAHNEKYVETCDAPEQVGDVGSSCSSRGC